MSESRHQESPLAPMRPQVALRDILWLVLACAGLWGWSYGLWDFWGADEPRYVQVAKELLSRHNWLLLTLNGEPYDQKPPLPFWLFAAMIKLTGGGVSAWAARLPPVLFGVLMVTLTYRIGAARFGRRVGWLAAWILLSSPLFAEEVPSARLDVIFAGWIALSMGAWLARRPEEEMSPAAAAVFWIGMIGAFFTKGPPVLAIVIGTLALEAWRARSWRPFAMTRTHYGLPILLALVAVWLWVLDHYFSPGYVRNLIGDAIVRRVSNPELHRRPFFYYLRATFAQSFVPWALLLAWALGWLWRRRKSPDKDYVALRPILIWLLWPFLFFSALMGKREQYLIPMFPAMALVTGWFVSEKLLDRPLAAWLRRLAAALAALAGALAWAAVLVFSLRGARWPALAQVAPGGGGLAAVALFGLAMLAAAWGWSRARDWKGAVVVMILMLYLTGLLVFGVVNPALNRHKSPLPLNSLIQARLGEGESIVGALGKDARKPIFQVYGSYRLVTVPTKPAALESQAATLPKIIVCESGSPSKDEKGRDLAGGPRTMDPGEATLVKLGYVKIFQASPTHDDVSVYERAAAPPKPGPAKAP